MRCASVSLPPALPPPVQPPQGWLPEPSYKHANQIYHSPTSNPSVAPHRLLKVKFLSFAGRLLGPLSLLLFKPCRPRLPTLCALHSGYFKPSTHSLQASHICTYQFPPLRAPRDGRGTVAASGCTEQGGQEAGVGRNAGSTSNRGIREGDWAKVERDEGVRHADT